MRCVEGTLENPKCYKLETFDFDSEEQIFDILLDILKSELPPRMAALKDCQNKPMYISESNIDLMSDIENNPHFEVVLNPIGDIPSYDDVRFSRIVEYSFELFLTVHNELSRCVTWELLRFKNAIEGLIIGAEFVIDGYQTVEIEPRGFDYFPPETDGAVYRKQGSYKFAVIVRQYKKDN